MEAGWKGKLSEDPEAFLTNAINHEAKAFVARNVDDVIVNGKIRPRRVPRLGIGHYNNKRDERAIRSND